MSLTARTVLVLVLLAASLGGAASHITDKLLAGLYAAPEVTEQPLRLLPSGTPLEVLQRRPGFHRVRLGDGTEGWVEARYVTEEKPAKAMLLEAQARIAQLQAELTATPDRDRTPEPVPPAAADADSGADSAAAAARGDGAGLGAGSGLVLGLALGLALGFVGGAAFVGLRRRGRARVE